jgi:hypothetical protein
MRSLKMLVIALGLGTVSMAHAFSVAPLTKAQQKIARQEIKQQLGPGTKVQSVKFGFGPTPTGFIGSGFEHATVKFKQDGTTHTTQFNVGPGLTPKSVNVWGTAPGRPMAPRR